MECEECGEATRVCANCGCCSDCCDCELDLDFEETEEWSRSELGEIDDDDEG